MMGVWLAAGGVVAGLALFARGLLAYLRALRVGGIATSPIASTAAGEVRVSGTVEPDAVLLVSPIQGERCVWYRSRVEESAGRSSQALLDETRAVGFRVRDPSGSIRVFPRGASFTVPDDLHESTGLMGGEPAGIRPNDGPRIVAATDDDVAAQVADLLTVRSAGSSAFPAPFGAGGGRRRTYAEARIEPGDAVTVLGWAVPFATLSDPAGADAGGSWDAAVPPDDPEVLADLAEARAGGTLAASAEAAWGNAAIPGFGIGRPVTPPELDPAAAPLPPGDMALAARAERRFEIPGDELVIAAGDGMALAVYDGVPEVAVDREQDRFLLGLAGAVLAIVSALALAWLIRGGALA